MNALADRRRSSRERRESLRAPFVAAVRSAHRDEEELALALDLSESGMRLRRCEGAGEAAVVRLEFELPDGGGPVVAAGRLLFEKRDGSHYAAGVRFVDLGTDDALRIARYVADHAGSQQPT